MMQNPLKIAPPPRRPPAVEAVPEPAPPAPVETEAKPTLAPRRAAAAPAKFGQVKEDERVQFNKRVTRRVADGFEMLAIRSRCKVPELLAEALELLEERYGRVG
jgi:hypothetical protein